MELETRLEPAGGNERYSVTLGALHMFLVGNLHLHKRKKSPRCLNSRVLEMVDRLIRRFVDLLIHNPDFGKGWVSKDGASRSCARTITRRFYRYQLVRKGALPWVESIDNRSFVVGSRPRQVLI